MFEINKINRFWKNFHGFYKNNKINSQIRIKT